MYYDVFNGDADGICALVQLRLAEPRTSQLVTGVKRDIQLLQQVSAAEGDKVTVLDISMKKNIDPLNAILNNGAEVFYCDHHDAGDIPQHKNLNALINLDANVCTAILINGYLKSQYIEWAITGAFGDNLKQSARALAKTTALSDAQIDSLEQLGILINYNGYGAAVEDLHFAPEQLYRELVQFSSPLDFMQQSRAVFDKLTQGYQDDMQYVHSISPELHDKASAVFILPNQSWARRVSGVYSNDLANDNPDRAHAVLTEKANGNYLVSIRAPLNNKQGANEIVAQFPTGGGRAAAAGVNDLPAAELERFMSVFSAYYA
ncbi:MAG: DHH family phosphoesterase [Pseudomonadales bacterium]|nr:DHH family phosphoesterase [Pseudomonadales bacterium]